MSTEENAARCVPGRREASRDFPSRALTNRGDQNGREPERFRANILKKRDEIGNHLPWARLVTDDGLSVPAYEGRCRRAVSARSGCAERAVERLHAGTRRR
jgi:hypothetical protein